MRPCGLELHIPCPVEQESSNAQNENWLLQSGSHECLLPMVVWGRLSSSNNVLIFSPFLVHLYDLSYKIIMNIIV